MDPVMDDPQSGKGKKSKSSKMPSRKSTTKVKVSLMLTEDVYFRLTVHAAALRTDRSAPGKPAPRFRTKTLRRPRPGTT